MELSEYLDTVSEQIRCKRARTMVREELKNHVQEQAEAYEADGMTAPEAMREAVRQMGSYRDGNCLKPDSPAAIGMEIPHSGASVKRFRPCASIHDMLYRTFRRFFQRSCRLFLETPVFLYRRRARRPRRSLYRRLHDTRPLSPPFVVWLLCCYIYHCKYPYRNHGKSENL